MFSQHAPILTVPCVVLGLLIPHMVTVSNAFLSHCFTIASDEYDFIIVLSESSSSLNPKQIMHVGAFCQLA
jgi:hypothetical protein